MIGYWTDPDDDADPPGGYRTVIVDPPWPQKGGGTLRKGVADGFEGAGGASLPMPYPVMSLEAIAALPIRDLADPTGSHLYLWTTNGFLRDAFDIVAGWGYGYPTTLVWAKTPMGGGLGGRFGISTEFLLHASRGVVPGPRRKRVRGTWQHWKRPYDDRGKPKHSAKPPQYRIEWVEAASPGPYLEMFARDPWPGWDSWGNQAINDVEVPALARELIERVGPPPPSVPLAFDTLFDDDLTNDGSRP